MLMIMMGDDKFRYRRYLCPAVELRYNKPIEPPVAKCLAEYLPI